VALDEHMDHVQARIAELKGLLADLTDQASEFDSILLPPAGQWIGAFRF
jgi:hypothetical protein